MTLCLPLAAFADAGYVSVPDLAKEHGLQYKDMSEGTVHAGKLTGKDIKVVLFADVRSITVNGVSAALAHPVRWNGAALEVPEEAVDADHRQSGTARRARGRTQIAARRRRR